MKRNLGVAAMVLLTVGWACGQGANSATPKGKPGAQSSAAKPAAVEIVPIDKEPSHHLVFENEYVRVFSVEVAPHAETKYHQHDRDYVWVSLGDSDVESVRVGASAVALQPKDGETQFTKGGFAHKAVNKSDKPFRNVTVELKKPGKVDERSSGFTIGTGQSLQTLVLAAENVSCQRNKPINLSPRGGLRLEAGKKYLIIASSSAYKSMEFGDRSGAVEISPGTTLWVEGLGEWVTQEGRSGIAYCRFLDEPQGPSRQQQGAQDDKAKGAAEK